MQDIHTIGGGGGGGGRLYGGGGGGDRRMRLHHHQTLGGQSPKCPRCDSANTKFCYYNNYNLSQPRHFCKACRRYWTKGGVLRNVPVGGGCRKAKRSSSASVKPKSAPKSNNSQSSSDSSSLTASVAAPPPQPEVASVSASATAPRVFNFSEGEVRPSLDPMASSSDHINPSFSPINPSFAPITSSSDQVNPRFAPMTSSSDPSPGGDIYSGSFTSLMTSSADPMMELNFGGDQQQWTRHQPLTTTMPEDVKISGSFLDPMVQIDLSGRHHGELGSLDHELFDLTGTVEQGYWNQPHWNDLDHSLYLP